MGPSFGKIPEIELPRVLMAWKICLLKANDVALIMRDGRLNCTIPTGLHFLFIRLFILRDFDFAVVVFRIIKTT